MTFNYLKVVKQLLGVYMQLMEGYHDYLFNLGHGCYMTIDLKYGYPLVPIHPEDYKFSIFTILDMD